MAELENIELENSEGGLLEDGMGEEPDGNDQ